jgi:hypothetical protein
MAVDVQSGSGSSSNVVGVIAGQQGESGNGRADGGRESSRRCEVGSGEFVVEVPVGDGGGEGVSCRDPVVHFVWGNSS